MVKIRGLKEARIKLGDIDRIIDNMLKKKKKIKILEAGCGYGRLMMDLSIKYNKKVEIVGMNLIKSHGDRRVMISNSLSEKIVNKKELRSLKFPKIIYGDAGVKLPFKTSSMDIVLSQTASYLFKDKIHFFEEVARILNKKGVGLITLPENPNLPLEFKPLLRIYNKGKQVSLKEYIKNFKRIRIKKLKPKREIIEIKGSKLNLRLKLESTINTNNLNKKWFGIQSIYVRK